MWTSSSTHTLASSDVTRRCSCCHGRCRLLLVLPCSFFSFFLFLFWIRLFVDGRSPLLHVVVVYASFPFVLCCCRFFFLGFPRCCGFAAVAWCPWSSCCCCFRHTVPTALDSCVTSVQLQPYADKGGHSHCRINHWPPSTVTPTNTHKWTIRCRSIVICILIRLG